MSETAKQWLHRIIGAFLQGAAHAGLAYAATAMAAPLAPALGIVALNWKQLICVMLGSGFLKLLGVLEKLGNFMQGKPDTGDFRIALAAAKGTGFGSFLQTYTGSTWTGTVAYPDIGAAQHLDSGGGATPGTVIYAQ